MSTSGWRATATAGRWVALAGRDVIVVDDGFATGVTALAALEAVRRERPARVVLAVPVAPADVAEIVGAAADAVVAVLTPSTFRAVGEFYDRFDQTTDAEVIALLRAPAALAVLKSQMHRNGASGCGERSPAHPGLADHRWRRTMASPLRRGVEQSGSSSGS